MDPALLATLRVHNPWLDRPGDQQALLAASVPEPFIARHRRLELRPGRAELVVGPRQVGKSTWIRQVLAQFEAPGPRPPRRGAPNSTELARPMVSRNPQLSRSLSSSMPRRSQRLPPLDTVEEGVPVSFVRPWEIDLVLDELQR